MKTSIWMGYVALGLLLFILLTSTILCSAYHHMSFLQWMYVAFTLLVLKGIIWIVGCSSRPFPVIEYICQASHPFLLPIMSLVELKGVTLFSLTFGLCWHTILSAFFISAMTTDFIAVFCHCILLSVDNYDQDRNYADVRLEEDSEDNYEKLSLIEIQELNLQTMAEEPNEETKEENITEDIEQVDDSQTNHQPRTKRHNSSQCTICQLVIHVGEMYRTLPCQHKFHQRCIDQWLMRRATCPNCKKIVCPTRHLSVISTR
mmetsp:Transcript_506/g.583  ORF Transcript_506/g.583 Transcript_506/m.583 type:complete len:260 (+) Transcript_506:92-871(+)